MAFGGVNVPGKLTAEDVNALPITGGTLTGDLRIKGTNNYGTKINLGDGDYVYISEPTDDCMKIHAKKLDISLSDTSTSKITINGTPLLAALGAVSASDGSMSGKLYFQGGGHIRKSIYNDHYDLELHGGTDGYGATMILQSKGGITVSQQNFNNPAENVILHGLAEPVSDTDAANKAYVDQNAGVPVIALVDIRNHSTGSVPIQYNVKLEPFDVSSTYGWLYTIDFSTNIAMEGSNKWYTMEIIPPARCAFIAATASSIDCIPFVRIRHGTSGSYTYENITGQITADGVIQYNFNVSDPLFGLELVTSNTAGAPIVVGLEVA